MAAHSNRSTFPVGASRPINPNLRNPDNNSGTRTSFSTTPSILTNSRRFEPTTPANSPSDFPRRRSVDSYPKEKENCEKDENLGGSKCQPSAKGSKNFMTPTISASSKFSPWPKKKVLVERNDPVGTSMSFLHGKEALFLSTKESEELESNPEIVHQKRQRNESSLESNDAQFGVSKSLKRVTFNVPSDSHSQSLLESVTTTECGSSSCLRNNEISCSSNPSTIAPLDPDPDPSLPPYDPKTNYLSPRPQFLHYKPNPRIEFLLNIKKGLEGKELGQLEESLLVAEILSESCFSDSESSEDSQNEDPQKEELGGVVSADMVVGIDEEIGDIPHAYELCESLQSGTSSPDDAVSEVNSVEKKQKKPQSVPRLLYFPIILMFLLTCGSIFVLHSPAFHEIGLNELRFSNMYHQSRLAASARMNFDRFAGHVNQFSVNSMSFIFNLANELVGGGGNNIGSPQFMNLSNLQCSGQNIEEFLLKKDSNEEELMEVVDFEEDDEFKGDANVEMGVDSDEKELEAQEEAILLEGFERDVEFEGVVDSETSYFEVYSDVNLVKEYGALDDALDAENMGLECIKLKETEPENSDNIEGLEIVDDGTEGLGVASSQEEDHHGNEVEDASDKAEAEASTTTSLAATGVPSSEDKLLFPVHFAEGLVSSTLIASLFAAAAAAYTYHQKQRLHRSEEGNIVLGGSKQTDQHVKNRCPQNWQQKEEGEPESWPSEISRFINNAAAAASYSRKEIREAVEAQSIERKTATRKQNSKRDERPPLMTTASITTSAAISSSEYTTGSPSSYGSFTTFERIPIKKNSNGDNEAITPVRRSSRLRNHHHHHHPHQVVSP